MRLDKREGHRIVSASLALVQQAMERYDFLENHSRVLVAVSGGVDSIVLLLLLNEYRKRHSTQWYLHACHVNPGFPGWNIQGIKHFFSENHIPYTIAVVRQKQETRRSDSKCYRCARERRKKLLQVAQKLGIANIALAHHTQDVAETLLLNMIYNGEFSTLTPKQSIIQGRYFFVRPLYYLDKKTIYKIAQTYRLTPYQNECGYFKDSKREEVRRFLETIKNTHPDTYNNIFRSIYHIKRSYLP